MSREAGLPDMITAPTDETVLAFEDSRLHLERLVSQSGLEAVTSVRYASAEWPINHEEKLSLVMGDYSGASRLMLRVVGADDEERFRCSVDSQDPEQIRQINERIPFVCLGIDDASERQWVQQLWQAAQTPRSENTHTAVVRLLDQAPGTVNMTAGEVRKFRGEFANGTSIAMQRSTIVGHGEQDRPEYIKVTAGDSIYWYFHNRDNVEELYVYLRDQQQDSGDPLAMDEIADTDQIATVIKAAKAAGADKPTDVGLHDLTDVINAALAAGLRTE